MIKIVIHDCTSTVYNTDTLNKDVLGGIEISTILLAEKLAQNGYEVTVRNNTNKAVRINGVEWLNYKDHLDSETQIDFVIANNDPNIFNSYKSAIKNGAKPVLWNHNNLTFNRFLKRWRWLSYFKYNIHGIFLSNDSLNKTPAYFRFKSKTIIPHFHNDKFFDIEPRDHNDILKMPFKNVLFISQTYRGLNTAIDAWKKYIAPSCPDARLTFYTNGTIDSEHFESYNIAHKPKKTHDDLLDDIKNSYALFYQGHKDETFCFAASEALCLGVPVVTMGIGALKNRVQNNINGSISNSEKAWAAALLNLLNNEDHWTSLRKNALAQRNQYHSESVMPLWLDALDTI